MKPRFTHDDLVDELYFYTSFEVAKKLRLPKLTVNRMIRAGKIKSINLTAERSYPTWRIPKSEIERILTPVNQ